MNVNVHIAGEEMIETLIKWMELAIAEKRLDRAQDVTRFLKTGSFQ